jgi:hypothetical protein
LIQIDEFVVFSQHNFHQDGAVMGDHAQATAQAPQQETETFRDVNDAFDQISPFLQAQFEFRQAGITYACNQLNQVDQPSLGAQLLKSGLKLGLAAAAGAVGAATGGLGFVALGAIGLGFGIGGEIVDAVFASGSAPQGVEEFRLSRTNTLTQMKARETQALRRGLNAGAQSDWSRALTDYQNMQQNSRLQQLEIDSTLDGWMNGLNSNANGTGGVMGQGSEELMDVTTGRLHLQGNVTVNNYRPSVLVRSATIDGLDNATLRNRYLDRTLGSIGTFCQFAFPLGGEWGGIGFQAGNSSWMIQGGQRFKYQLGQISMTGPAFTTPNYDWSADAFAGAERITDILLSWTLRDLGIREVAAGGMFE